MTGGAASGHQAWTVRDATAGDAAACAVVYAPYVVSTAVSFELEPPDAEALAERIREAQQHYAWLVLVEDARVVGYAYAGPWRSRAAYRFTGEASVYVEAQQRVRGGGRLLYEQLLDRLSALGYRMVIAVAAEPNPASAALHHSVGFSRAGTLPAIGYKFGAWHDHSLYSLGLPPPTRPS